MRSATVYIDLDYEATKWLKYVMKVSTHQGTTVTAYSTLNELLLAAEKNYSLFSSQKQPPNEASIKIMPNLRKAIELHSNEEAEKAADAAGPPASGRSSILIKSSVLPQGEFGTQVAEAEVIKAFWHTEKTSTRNDLKQIYRRLAIHLYEHDVVLPATRAGIARGMMADFRHLPEPFQKRFYDAAEANLLAVLAYGYWDTVFNRGPASTHHRMSFDAEVVSDDAFDDEDDS